MPLTDEQIQLERERELTTERPTSLRGHVFKWTAHISYGGANGGDGASQNNYVCDCGATYATFQPFRGPTEYTPVVFDCPLQGQSEHEATK